MTTPSRDKGPLGSPRGPPRASPQAELKVHPTLSFEGQASSLLHTPPRHPTCLCMQGSTWRTRRPLSQGRGTCWESWCRTRAGTAMGTPSLKGGVRRSAQAQTSTDCFPDQIPAQPPRPWPLLATSFVPKFEAPSHSILPKTTAQVGQTENHRGQDFSRLGQLPPARGACRPTRSDVHPRGDTDSRPHVPSAPECSMSSGMEASPRGSKRGGPSKLREPPQGCWAFSEGPACEGPPAAWEEGPGRSPAEGEPGATQHQAARARLPAPQGSSRSETLGSVHLIRPWEGAHRMEAVGQSTSGHVGSLQALSEVMAWLNHGPGSTNTSPAPGSRDARPARAGAGAGRETGLLRGDEALAWRRGSSVSTKHAGMSRRTPRAQRGTSVFQAISHHVKTRTCPL